MWLGEFDRSMEGPLIRFYTLRLILESVVFRYLTTIIILFDDILIILLVSICLMKVLFVIFTIQMVGFFEFNCIFFFHVKIEGRFWL